MAQRKTLTEQQVAVLRWIAEGCPDGVMEGYAHRVSAVALRRRGLVLISGRGPTWGAAITPNGREYLRHVDGDDPPIARQANVSVTQQLVDEVIAAGGSKRYPQRHYWERGKVDHANRAALAQRYGKVPAGKQLKVTSVSPDELQIDLVDGPDEPAVALEPVPVPDRVSKYHPVVRQFKNQRERHEVSRGALPRVLRIVHGLVTEAERRGYDVAIASSGDAETYSRQARWVGSKHGHFVIATRGFSGAFRIREEGLTSRQRWEDQNRRYTSGEWRLPSVSEYEAGATGRLTIDLVQSWGRSRWADRASWTLEEKLPELLQEVELRAIKAEERRAAAEREAAEREVAWKAAMERARERHAEHHRGEVLKAQVARWRQVGDIRAYCDAAESFYADDPAASAWIAWARSYADSLDPLAMAPRTPADPESVPAEELRPFLDGWDPYSATRRRW